MKDTLDAKQLGLALGILAGLCMLILTWLSILWGYGTEILNLMASIYPGYTLTWGGSFVGLIYGFIDGLIGGYIIAWLYNWAGTKS